MEIKFHGNYTIKDFWLDWFGIIGGRELGTNKKPHRNWTDNPDDLLDFIEMCELEHEEGDHCRPCWISSQPMRLKKEKVSADGFKRRIGETMALEKLFYDFDDKWKKCKSCGKEGWDLGIKGKDKKKRCPKCDALMTKDCAHPRLDVVGEEVKRFIRSMPSKPKPFIVRTRKGFHVYLFLRRIRIFQKSQFWQAKELYEALQRYFINTAEGEYIMLDNLIIGDIMRFARVPLTIHEETGERCLIVDEELKVTKVRELDFYKKYGIMDSIVDGVVEEIKKKDDEKTTEKHGKMKYIANGGQKGGFTGNIRPCFMSYIESGVMCHQHRLAFVIEAHFAGKTGEEICNYFKDNFGEYDEDLTLYQVTWQLKKIKRDHLLPYKCETLRRLGWCLEKECPRWKNKSREKQEK